MDRTKPSWNIFNCEDIFIFTVCGFKFSFFHCSAFTAAANLLAERVSSSTKLHLLQRAHMSRRRENSNSTSVRKRACLPPWHAP